MMTFPAVFLRNKIQQILLIQLVLFFINPLMPMRTQVSPLNEISILLLKEGIIQKNPMALAPMSR